jgi:hypothetical protein
MTENPEDPTSQTPPPSSEKPPLADQIRAKLDEYEVDRHLNDIATTVEQAVRTGMAKAGELAHEHKGDLERLFDKAADAVDRRTEGKHAEKIQQVRGSLERGVDKIAEQRDGGAAPTDPPGSGVPPADG